MSKENLEFVEGILWNSAQDIENLGYKVSNAANVIEIIAAVVEDEPTSGALWFLRDSLKDIADKIIEYSDKMYDDRKAMMDSRQPTKSKKSK